MPEEFNNNLAIKIAQLLQTENREIDFHSIQKEIEKISARLEKIESVLQNQNNQTPQPSSLFFNNLKHPSQEKFDVSEMMSLDTIKDNEFEKPCPYEPTGKTCDHCSMCNSRGF